MNKNLKVVVGSAAVALACAGSVRGSAPLNLMNEPEFRPALELFDNYVQVKEGKASVQALRERLSESVLNFYEELNAAMLGLQSISTILQAHAGILDENTRWQLDAGLRVIVSGFGGTVSQLALWGGFAGQVIGFETSSLEETETILKQQLPISREASQPSDGNEGLLRKIATANQASNEELLRRFVSLQQRMNDELVRRIASMQANERPVQVIETVSAKTGEEIKALSKKTLETVDGVQRVLSGIAVPQLAEVGVRVATIEEKIDHKLGQ